MITESGTRPRGCVRRIPRSITNRFYRKRHNAVNKNLLLRRSCTSSPMASRSRTEDLQVPRGATIPASGHLASRSPYDPSCGLLEPPGTSSRSFKIQQVSRAGFRPMILQGFRRLCRVCGLLAGLRKSNPARLSRVITRCWRNRAGFAGLPANPTIRRGYKNKYKRRHSNNEKNELQKSYFSLTGLKILTLHLHVFYITL